MKRIILTFFCTFLTVLYYGNDGGYGLNGDTLHPINIADISLDYERLTFYRKNNRWEVEVYIELNNQTNQTIKPLLGFEFVAQKHDFAAEDFIQYVLSVNGEEQKYRHTSAGEASSTEILLYNPQLHPGINKVYHYYVLKEGDGSLNGYLEYILTIGGRWKDGIIKNLEIFIHSDTAGMLKPIFHQEWQWANTDSLSDFDVIGQCKIYDGYFSYDNDGRFYVMSDKGYLYKHLTNYRPIHDMRFRFFSLADRGYMNTAPSPNEFVDSRNFQPYKYIFYWNQAYETLKYEQLESGEKASYEQFIERLSTMTKEELRILRNTVYAIQGYVFNDASLQDLFKNQYWYFPNPNIRQENIKLDTKMNRILQEIQNAER